VSDPCHGATANAQFQPRNAHHAVDCRDRAHQTRKFTVFGGSDVGDSGTEIVTNGSNTAYVVGYINSANFPTTLGAYQTTRTSTQEAFVIEITSVGDIVHPPCWAPTMETHEVMLSRRMQREKYTSLAQPLQRTFLIASAVPSPAAYQFATTAAAVTLPDVETQIPSKPCANRSSAKLRPSM
jgi:hypothetical protein